MNVRSETVPSCSELRDEIQRLESELKTIDEQLGEVSLRIVIRDDEGLNGHRDLPREPVVLNVVDEPETWLAAATEERNAMAQDRADVSKALRSRAGQERLPRTKLEGETESRGSQNTSSRRRRRSHGESRVLRWFGMAVVLAAVAGFWQVVLRPVLRGDFSRVEPVEMEMFEAARAQELAQATEALKQFYAASSVRELLPWVRGSQSVEPLIRRHYQAHPLQPREIEVIESERVSRGEARFVSALVRDEAGEIPERWVAVELSADGARVDWELATNVQRDAWLALPTSNGLSSAQPFRIEIREAYYFDDAFDETTWHCFQVSAPEADKPVYAYAPRQSELARRLVMLLEAGKPRAARVIASFVPRGEVDVVRQLKIIELVAEDWFVPVAALPLHEGERSNGLVSLN